MEDGQTFKEKTEERLQEIKAIRDSFERTLIEKARANKKINQEDLDGIFASTTAIETLESLLK